MEGPHTNVGTWAPSYLATLLVISILSRIVERIIFHSYIYPAFLKPPVEENIKDQFAFRPTGSIHHCSSHRSSTANHHNAADERFCTYHLPGFYKGIR